MPTRSSTPITSCEQNIKNSPQNKPGLTPFYFTTPISMICSLNINAKQARTHKISEHISKGSSRHLRYAYQLTETFDLFGHSKDRDTK